MSKPDRYLIVGESSIAKGGDDNASRVVRIPGIILENLGWDVKQRVRVMMDARATHLMLVKKE